MATPLRWLGSSALLIGATLAALRAYYALSQSLPTGRAFAAAAVLCAAEALLVLTLLRGEELRLNRELRTARQGTPVLRAMVGRRRQRGPLFARLFATRLGAAAVFLADGDESAARDVLAQEPPWMHVGRLGCLRAVVLADADRATGTAAARLRCVRQLSAARHSGNREADLYRVHVLVKAMLEQGDGEAALDLATRLVRSEDEDERIYGTWLRVWFELDSAAEEAEWPALGENEARLAAMRARSQGAEALVGKLEARRVAIARTTPQG